MLNIPSQQKKSSFPKVIKQSEPVADGLYKAVFKQFITLGFQENEYDGEKNTKFYTNYGFELIEDMAGNKVPKHVREYDDGSTTEEPKFIFREYTLTQDMHHKSNGFTLAKALSPTVAVVKRGKNKEHGYIIDFDWKAALETSVLVQVETRVAKESGNKYNKLINVMQLGIPMETEGSTIFFSLYDNSQEMQDVFNNDVSFFDKKKIRESVVMPGEPEVIYRAVGDDKPVDIPHKQEEKKDPIQDVDFDDDIPF